MVIEEMNSLTKDEDFDELKNKYQEITSVLAAHQIALWEYDIPTGQCSFTDDYFRILGLREAGIVFENIDDFYRYYFSWFELYRKIVCENWEDALQQIEQLDNFVPALFRKQEVFWLKKNDAVKAIIASRKKVSPYDFCHNLVETRRNEQSLSKFFYRGLMLSDLQYTSYV